MNYIDLKKIEAEIITNEGRKHLESNELETALSSLYYATKLDPKNMEAPYYMAKIFIKMNMPQGALKSIELIYKNL